MKQWEADIGDLQNGEWPADAQKRRHGEKLAADAAAASLQVDADHHCHQPLRSGRTPKPQDSPPTPNDLRWEEDHDVCGANYYKLNAAQRVSYEAL